MATNIWLGCTTAVAQVDTFTPDTVEVDDVFTLTITDDAGNTHAVSYTATAATVANVTAGLTAAWNADTHRLCTPITAADETTYMTLTADTAGVPFSVASTTTDGGGNDTQTLTRAAGTANSGPNDYGVVNNWSLGAIPVDTNDVVVPPGTPAILYGLNQASVAIASFTEMAGHANAIGRIDDYGYLYCLRIDPDALTLEGSGSLCAIDIGTAAIDVFVNHTGSPSATGRQVVYLKGSAIDEVIGRNGYGSIGRYPGHTATVTGGFELTGGYWTIGAGTTVTGTTLRARSAYAYVYASVPTVTIDANAHYYQEAGAWTTGYVLDGGKVYPNAAGTYATTKVYEGGEVDKSQTFTSVTFTNTEVYGTSNPINDPLEQITFTNAITHPDKQGRRGLSAS